MVHLFSNQVTSSLVSSRKSNFELLRLVLMFMILVHHAIVFGVGMYELSVEKLPPPHILDNGFFWFIINNFCIVAVNVFVLLSGFFGIKYNKERLLTVLFDVLIYTILFTSSVYLVKGDFKLSVSSMLIFSQTRYWFLKDYVILMLISPLLNSFFDTDQWKYNKAVIPALLFCSCYLGFLWNDDVNTDGYTLFQFITLYTIGRYIRAKDISISINKSILLYLLPVILNCVVCLYFWSKVDFIQVWKLTYYNSPIVILSSIGLFLVFKNLNISNEKINIIAKHSLGVYLFHCSYLVFPFFIRVIESFQSYPIPLVLKLFLLILVSLFTFIVSICVDFFIKPLSVYVTKKMLGMFSHPLKVQ